MTTRIRNANAGATANWPTKYRAQFWSRRRLPYQAAALMFLVGTLKSPVNLLKVLGGLATAGIAGGLIGAVSGFHAYWLVFSLGTIVLVIAGSLTAIFSYPRRSGIFDWYEPGTVTQIAVADGTLVLSLNSHVFRRPVDSVVKVWHFGELSAIETSDRRSIVIPTAFVPHRVASGAGREINARWGNPARRQ